MRPLLFDAHNHLQDHLLQPHLSRVLAEFEDIGIGGSVINGTMESDWSAVAALASAHSWAIPSFGLHPWYSKERSGDWQEKLVRHLDAESGPVGIGEIGLDRWIEDYDFDDQLEVFTWQLRLSAERNLPASIHCLQAWGALHDTLRAEPLPACGFLIHAYGGPPELVGPFAKLGAYFSFNGSILHERKEARRKVFGEIPPERLLIETDAPAMPPPEGAIEFPLPRDGSGRIVNHPANLRAVYQALAPMRAMSVEELAALAGENLQRLFA